MNLDEAKELAVDMTADFNRGQNISAILDILDKYVKANILNDTDTGILDNLMNRIVNYHEHEHDILNLITETLDQVIDT